MKGNLEMMAAISKGVYSIYIKDMIHKFIPLILEVKVNQVIAHIRRDKGWIGMERNELYGRSFTHTWRMYGIKRKRNGS